MAWDAPSYVKPFPTRHSPVTTGAWTQIAICKESPPSPTLNYWMDAVNSDDDDAGDAGDAGDADGRHVVPWNAPSHPHGRVSDADTQTPAAVVVPKRVVGFEVPSPPERHEYDAQHGKHNEDGPPHCWHLHNPPCIVQQ